MHPAALLDLATDLLASVLKLDAPADTLVSMFFRQHRALGARERHALAETAYAVLRRKLLLQHLATAGGGGGPATAARRMAVLGWQGNAAFLRAALPEHEQLWLARCDAVDRTALPDKLRHNLPDWLAHALRDALAGARAGGGKVGEPGDAPAVESSAAMDAAADGAPDADPGADMGAGTGAQQGARTDADGGFDALVAALDGTAPLDLRVNTLKGKRDDAQRALAEAGIEAVPTPHSPWGLRIDGKPALNALPVFKDGHVEVQDEGSQLLALLVDAHRGEMVVDFCAGAGGKTLALGASMRNTGRLYAFDVSGHRLEGLKPRLARSGLSNVHPAQIAHERDDRIKRLAGKIDRVLVDAPCSGLGTLRRNPDLKWRHSPGAIDAFALRQAAILRGAARLLRPGGRLVYATCSLLAAENERIADAFTAERGGDYAPLAAEAALRAAGVEHADTLVAGPYLRLWPHRHRSDGYFAAAWTRR